MANSIHTRIALQAAGQPGSAAIFSAAGERLTYAELLTAFRYVQAAIRQVGLQATDRVAVVLPDGPEIAIAFLGISAAAVYAPLNSQSPNEELTKALRALRARALVCEPKHRHLAEQLGLIPLIWERQGLLSPTWFRFAGVADPRPCSDWPDDPKQLAVILHTSGTTSRPRRVLLPHQMLTSVADSYQRSCDLTNADRCLGLTPLFHALGLNGAIVAPLWSGGSTVLTAGFDPASINGWLRVHDPTWFSAVPAMLKTLAEDAAGQQNKANRLRFIRTISAPLAPAVRTAIEDCYGVPVIQAYGLTEALIPASTPLDPLLRKAGSVGAPVAGEIAILGPDASLRRPGERGEVILRGENVTPGYDDDEENRAAFWNGWFRTGDEGYVDEQGYLFLTGRIKEIINRGGEKITPAQVDAVLLEHPSVRQATVFGIPDARLGEEVAAAVILRPGHTATERELQQFVAARLADYQVPRRVFFTNRIPTNATGKAQRNLCADLFRMHTAIAANVAAPRELSPTEGRLLQIYQELLPGRHIGPDDSFFDLGGHSLDAVRLLVQIEEEFGIHLHGAQLWGSPTIATLAAILDSGASTAAHWSVIDSRGEGVPIIFIDPNLGYTHLWRALAGHYPLYGLQLPKIDGEISFSQAAVLLSERIAAVFPHRPVALAGWCLSGVLAYEVARQMAAAGHPPPTVLMFDAHNILRSDGNRLRRGWCAALRSFEKLWFHLGRIRKQNWTEGVRYFKARASAVFARTERNIRIARGIVPGNVEARWIAALRRYRASAYAGRVVHLMAQLGPRSFGYAKAVWSPVVRGPLEWREVPGDHNTMFSDGHSAALAAEIEAALTPAPASPRLDRIRS